MDAGLLATFAGLAGALVTGATAWLISRRTASGKIATTEAATLWAAVEKMLAAETARADKVTEQRDRLIESQTAMVIPMLTAVNESLQQIAESLSGGGP